VLAFSPTVERALRWFDATHEIERRDGAVWWRRCGLPGPGAVSEQDPQLMAAMDLLREVHDDLLRPRTKTKPTDA
jgi:hypothetical protein